MGLFAELKRRNVIRVAVAYLVFSWLLLQVGDILFQTLELPAMWSKGLLAVIALGFIPALIFSWIYELTPDGIKKESEVSPNDSKTAHTAKKLDVAVIVLLIAAMGMFALDRFTGGNNSEDASTVQQPAPSGTETGVPAAVSEVAKKVLDASVAVLPFTTRSTNEEDVFFSDGVHDDLLTYLAKIGDLKVISRTSVMEYRDTIKRIPDIAAELGVATIVEGAVQRSGTTVRITAQLIDAETDEHLWAEIYDRQLTAENLFAIQTEIATSIAKALSATLGPQETAALQRRLTNDLVAADAYRRARWQMSQGIAQSIDAAIQQLKFALERDPEFSAAYSLLARVYLRRVWNGNGGDEDRAAAWQAIQKGRALDANLPEHDIAEGYYHYWGFYDYPKALAVLGPVIEHFPNDSELHQVLAWIYRRSGEYEKSLRHMQLGINLDPRQSVLAQALAETHLRLRDYDKGLLWAERTLQMAPGDTFSLVMRARAVLLMDNDLDGTWRWLEQASVSNPWIKHMAWWTRVAAADYETALSLSDMGADQFSNRGSFPKDMVRGLTHLYSGDREKVKAELLTALAVIDSRVSEGTHSYHDVGALCVINGALGDREKAETKCRDYLELAPPDQFEVSTFWTLAATGLALAGAEDEALDLIERSLTARAGVSWPEIGYEPAFRGLHDHSRWQALQAEHGGAR